MNGIRKLDDIDQRRVSVIVRSMDRTLVREALDSIAIQDYPDIEVIVVNAKGGIHSEVGARCGSFPLRVVGDGVPLKRSQAANLGLQSAHGEYLIFLDDDDWFSSGHISGLVAALEQDGTAQAAYAGVMYASALGAIDGVVMDTAFDANRLRLGNFIPIHAVLFRKALLGSGCRFDENLEVYEDWDFWLQLSRLTPFVHVNQVSAGYRNSGTSGVGPSGEASVVRQARGRVFEKWKGIWSGEEMHELINHAIHVQAETVERLQRDTLQLVNAVEERDHLAKSLTDRIDQQEIQAGYLSEILHERNLQIEKILNSSSWKVSAPLRWVGYQIIRIKKLTKCLLPLRHKPREIPSTVTRLYYVWKRGGTLAVKQLLLQLPFEVSFNDVWLQYRQTFTSEVETEIAERISNMDDSPLISILMPTYNTPENMLRQTIESVLCQLYPNWELCIVDDASPRAHVRRILQDYASRESRIRLVFSERNSGIAAATNRALGMAKGQFVALLDHDDILEKQALFRLAESIVEDDPDMIYSDEAMLSEDGSEVVNHVYRPAFSPELLRSCPYIVHLVAFRADLLRDLGGLDESLSISQDYDLILRASERSRSIVHIPEILYLWRQRKSSAGHEREGEVMETSRNVLTRHLERCGEKGMVCDGALFNYFDVRYALEAGQRVAIIIPTKNHGELVRQCIESIKRTVKDVVYDIVVVDHDSDDPATLAYFRALKAEHQILRYEGPFNFSAINNWAVSRLERGYTHYLFCNNDIEATNEGWLERMMELGQKPDIGLVGAMLYYPDGRTFQHAGVCVGMFGIAEHYAKFMDNKLPNGAIHPGYHGALIVSHEVSAVTAACLLMRRDAFEKIGGFDEKIAVGFGDVDLSLRAGEAGYRNIFCPHAALIHHESYTRGKSHEDPHPEDSAFFTQKWRKFLDKGDPYYNPHLSLYSTRWDIKQPMEFDLDVSRRVVLRPPVATS